MNDEWWMMDDEWWMMNDEWRMTNDEWWTMNDWASHELRMMNDESRIINDEWCLCSSKCWTEKSHPFLSKVSQKLDQGSLIATRGISAEHVTSQRERLNSSLPCRKDWIGPHYKRKDCLHPSHAQQTLNWSTSQKERHWIHPNQLKILNGFTSQKERLNSSQLC